MRKTILMLIIAFLGSFCYGQKQQRIIISEIENNTGNIIIKYKIENYNRNDKFKIELIVKGSNNENIKAKTIRGDVGENIYGGENKQIVWSFEKDGVYLDETIEIQLKADVVNTNLYSTSNLLLASTIEPGKGVTILNPSNNYKVWTIAGYSLVASSALLYGMSKLSYSRYKTETSITVRDKYYKNYKYLTYASYSVAASALSLWIVNYFRVFVAKKRYNSAPNLSLYPTYNYMDNSNMLTFNIKF